jgi:hypothetical protein
LLIKLKIMKTKSLILLLLLAIVYGCSDDPAPQDPLKTGNDILTFSLTEQTGAALINSTDYTIVIEVENNTDRTNLTPTFTLSEGATSSPTSGAVGDYSDKVTVTVTAQDGTSQAWEIDVNEATIASSSEKDILTFSFPEQTAAADIDNLAHNVKIEVISGTNRAKLTPTFTLSNGATAAPVSGTEGDYVSQAIIKVTAENGSTQDWEVDVTVGQSSSADVLGFSFAEQTTLASIDNTAKTITIEVANGTNLSSLTPDIIVSPGATSVPESGATGDYSGVVTLTVTAQDGNIEKAYAVTVTAASAPGGPLNTGTDILTFIVPGQELDAVIDPERFVIGVKVPPGTDLSNITPTFTLSTGAISNPVTGTPGDYSDAKFILVTAEDGVTTQLWAVKIFGSFDAASICDVANCATDEALKQECITFLETCIANHGEAAAIPCILVALGPCDE